MQIQFPISVSFHIFFYPRFVHFACPPLLPRHPYLPISFCSSSLNSVSSPTFFIYFFSSLPFPTSIPIWSPLPPIFTVSLFFPFSVPPVLSILCSICIFSFLSLLAPLLYHLPLECIPCRSFLLAPRSPLPFLFSILSHKFRFSHSQSSIFFFSICNVCL